ncbi:17523_t:CDS:2 [Gigaspora rosea]|nr:17523_t:CDS:2 [Gigaspora rosea]
MWRNVLNDANPKEELLGNLREANSNPARDANVLRNEDPLVNPDQRNNPQQDDPNPQTLQLLQVIANALAGQRGPQAECVLKEGVELHGTYLKEEKVVQVERYKLVDSYPVEEASDERYDALLLKRTFQIIDDLDQDSNVDPIMPLETASRTWEEKLDNMCKEIETLNPQVQSNAYVLEMYYKMGDLMSERCWRGEDREKLYQRITRSKERTNMGTRFFRSIVEGG